MDAKTLAGMLNGCEYRSEITSELEAEAKKHGLVVVFGASDDLMEFRGAIHDELDANNGTTAHLTPTGLLQNDCDDDECPHFTRAKESTATIEALWDSFGYSWTYSTQIRHETFEVLESGEPKYCRGIVFALADIGTAKAEDGPQWIVNDLGELGVKVGSRFFFLYKGDNIEYGNEGNSKDGVAMHDDGTQMQYRVVGKREFGEVCFPLKWLTKGSSDRRYTENLVHTPGLSFGTPEDGCWKPLPATK